MSQTLLRCLKAPKASQFHSCNVSLPSPASSFSRTRSKLCSPVGLHSVTPPLDYARLKRTTKTSSLYDLKAISTCKKKYSTSAKYKIMAATDRDILPASYVHHLLQHNN